jgi:superfamily II DNA or RNA helicase
MLVKYDNHSRAILRIVDDFGFQSYDLVSMPQRIAHLDVSPPLVETNIDRRRVVPIETPSQLIAGRLLESNDNWLAMSSRTLARVYATFLITEDPQRRLDARKAATLMHQVSLVQHILERTELRKVLIGDEVGLGKTIEAGLLIQQLLGRNPSIRVLYLAPARLVRNVANELREKLNIDARQWIAGGASDARLESDKIVIASIHKASFGDNLNRVAQSGPWDVVIVDECHHLSDWDPSGGKPNQSFKLVSQLLKAQRADGRLVLMSGTPHQGSEARFKNILRLLSDDGKSVTGAAGRVIYRTKDRVRDWRGAPLFPSREIRQPVVVHLGQHYVQWYLGIAALYDSVGKNGGHSRAAGWAKGQALQWAASSVQAGLGFLVRLSMRRLNWTLADAQLVSALSALRPYRGGRKDESLETLYARLKRQIGADVLEPDDDDGERDEEDDVWRPAPEQLGALLEEGVNLIKSNAAQSKWDAVCKIIDGAGDEKIVLFAQPVETVTVVAEILESRYGQRPAIIIGNQSDEERVAQVTHFQTDGGARFLVSSKAGGEGLNMQRARRMIHLDVPWNPMDLEQRIGRIHRFGSRKTILVDTVVAAGSREIDMYRIARDKLALIAKHLDPEQFETLFSRVMSLVPPKELESILGDFSGGSGMDGAASHEIGRLVTEGFRSWSSFDDEYRKQANEIRAVNPGQAGWSDVGAFLVKYGGADDAAEASFNSFQFHEKEIVAIDEQVPTVTFNDKLYACGDTGGLPATGEDGRVAITLGLSLDEVQDLLRRTFEPPQRAGAAFVKRPASLPFLGEAAASATLLVFFRQMLQQQRGRWVEKMTSLHVFSMGECGPPLELSPQQRAAVVRALQAVPRVKDPTTITVRAGLLELEQELTQSLRHPSDEEIALGVRYAVWPIATIVLIV